MKLILMMGLMGCLNGCQAFPTFNNEDPVERCFPYIQAAGEGLYSGKCRCHQYLVKNGHVGRVSDSVDRPLDYCHKFASFSPDSWVEFVNWFESIFKYVNRAKKEFRRGTSKQNFPIGIWRFHQQ